MERNGPEDLVHTCRGVPVMSRRCAVLSMRTVWENWEASFLSRWASSMIKYCHANLLNAPFSRLQISYVVNSTSQSRSVPGLRRSAIKSARSSWRAVGDPIKGRGGMERKGDGRRYHQMSVTPWKSTRSLDYKWYPNKAQKHTNHRR